MPHPVSHPDDVPVFAGLVQWLLWLGDPGIECTHSGERPVTGADSGAACRPGWRCGQSAHLGRPALRREAVWPSSGGAPDASGGLIRRATATAVAEETLGGPSSGDPQSSGTGLHRDRAQYQMGDRHHLPYAQPTKPACLGVSCLSMSGMHGSMELLWQSRACPPSATRRSEPKRR